MKLRQKSWKDRQFSNTHLQVLNLQALQLRFSPLESKPLKIPTFFVKLSVSPLISKNGQFSAWKKTSRTVNTYKTNSIPSPSRITWISSLTMVTSFPFITSQVSKISRTQSTPTSRTTLRLMSQARVERARRRFQLRLEIQANQSSNSSLSLSQTAWTRSASIRQLRIRLTRTTQSSLNLLQARPSTETMTVSISTLWDRSMPNLEVTFGEWTSERKSHKKQCL